MPKVRVDLVADISRYLGGLRRAETATSRFATTTRHSFSLLATTLVGGTGVAYGLRQVVNAAAEAQTALGQTKVAVKNAGLSWNQYSGQIIGATKSLQRLSGFSDEDALRAFNLLIRANQDVGKSLRLMGVAADVARGRNMDLVRTAQLLVLVQAGQVGSLRRLGIEVKKGTSGTQALIEVSKQYAGAAAAFGRSGQGSIQRFHEGVRELEESIGKALLPTLTQYLNKASDWLLNTKNQATVERDARDAIHGVAAAIRGLTKAITTTTKVIKPLVDGLGGVQNAVELAFGAYALAKLAKFRRGLLGVAAAETAVAGGAAAGKAGKGGILAFLGGPAAIAGEAIGFSYLFNKGKRDEAKRKWDSLSAQEQHQIVAKLSEDQRNALLNVFGYKLKPLPRNTGGAGAAGRVRNRPAKPAGGTPSTGRVPSRPLTEQEQVTLALANAAEGSNAQIAALRKQQEINRKTIAFAQKLLSQHRGDTGKLVQTIANLSAQDKSIDSQINSILDGRVSVKQAATAKRKRTADKLVKANLEAARELTRGIQAEVTGRFPLTQKQFIGLGDTRGGTTGTAVKGGQLTNYVAASARKLTAGLGLAHDTRVELEQRFSQANMHHGRVPTGTAAMGYGLPGVSLAPTVIQLTIDKKILGQVVLEEMRRMSKNGVASTRGRHGGHNLALS